MAIPIINNWKKYFSNPDEGLGSSYERIILNRKLRQIYKEYRITNALEAPIFGFTGITGINSVELAKNGCKITLLDHDEERGQLARYIWKLIGFQVAFRVQNSYNFLDFEDKYFDMSWNFSALWFVEDLNSFLSELSRVTKKVILICVPNRYGLGFLTQKYFSDMNNLTKFYSNNIIPKNFVNILKKNGWNLNESNLIDCPPWPDIGMPKLDFLKKIKLDKLCKTEHKPVTILDHYQRKDPYFEYKMLKYSWLEKYAPKFLKLFWAHHKYFLFVPEN
ncbi:MAG: methyltransferase domain-containing protein [Candidatus Cloacimonadota bacterium]|nr:methyltransferase domain-containing protein [Candidatus Cloacimonadota bacterium]